MGASAQIRLLILGALATAFVLALAAPALAATYTVRACTATDTSEEVVRRSFSFDFNFGLFACGNRFDGGFRVAAGAGGVAGGPLQGSGGWSIKAPADTTIQSVEVERAFSFIGPSNGLQWLVLKPTGPALETVNVSEPPPPNGFKTFEVNGDELVGFVWCPKSAGCNGGIGTSTVVTSRNFEIQMEDNSPPTISLAAPSSTTPLHGTVQIPYLAEDKGSGILSSELHLDLTPPVETHGLLDRDNDDNGGKCTEVPGGGYGLLVPCRLKIIDRSFSVDTTKIPDGVHTVTPIVVDATAVGAVFGDPVTITVRNAPFSTERPVLSGTARVGQSLTVGAGKWDRPTTSLEYKWLQCPASVKDDEEAGCTVIRGATQSRYSPVAGDIGKRLLASVTAANGINSSTALSPPSDVVGDAPVGREASGTAPQTKLIKHPRKKSAIRKARFAFGADQPGSTFQCKLDKGPFKACRSPFKHKVKPGRHSFQVRAVNSAGVADQTPAKFNWRVS